MSLLLLLLLLFLLLLLLLLLLLSYRIVSCRISGKSRTVCRYVALTNVAGGRPPTDLLYGRPGGPCSVTGIIIPCGWLGYYGKLINQTDKSNYSNRIKITTTFYRTMLCIVRTMLSHDVCPSVRPSHAGILSKRLNVSSNFSPRV